MHDKKAFIKSLMNPEPESIEIVQINLDISDITICDILRNFNTVFPENCRDRFEMRDGKKVYTCTPGVQIKQLIKDDSKLAA